MILQSLALSTLSNAFSKSIKHTQRFKFHSIHCSTILRSYKYQLYCISYKYQLYCIASLPEAYLLLMQLTIESIPYACNDDSAHNFCCYCHKRYTSPVVVDDQSSGSCSCSHTSCKKECQIYTDLDLFLESLWPGYPLL